MAGIEIRKQLFGTSLTLAEVVAKAIDLMIAVPSADSIISTDVERRLRVTIDRLVPVPAPEVVPTTTSPRPRSRRSPSAAARKKMSDARRRYWAAKKATKTAKTA